VGSEEGLIATAVMDAPSMGFAIDYT
jgi:hypothetical protein